MSEERIHLVCAYMRGWREEKRECLGCPAWEKDPRYGKTKRMCRAIAEEVMSVVIHGTPYPPRWIPSEVRGSLPREKV